MAYGSSMRRTRFSGSSPTVSKSRNAPTQNSFANTQVWRHQFTQASPSTGSANALTSNNSFIQTMLRTSPTFTSGADVAPTPDFSNHYVGNTAFNGSRLEDYNSLIRLKNNDAVTRYLDVYESTLSFLDATNWISVMGASSVPVSQALTTVDAGKVEPAGPPAPGQINAQTYDSFLTMQKFMPRVGTLELGPAGSGDNTVTLQYDSIPPKCRRANHGMYWGLFFHNDFNKNGVTTLNISFNAETGFTEIPSSNRVPFKQ